MKQIQSILFLIVCLSLQPLYAEELKLTEPHIEFTAIHPFKTVIGNCTKINVSPVVFTKTTNGLQIPKSVKIEIPIKEIRSGDENRDEHILELLGYPVQQNISFTSVSISSKDGEWVIAGGLTVNGITKQVKTTASIKSDDHGSVVSGKFQVLMSDFGIDPPSLLFAKAKEEVVIEYTFNLKP